MHPLATGKLPAALLASLLERHRVEDPRVIVGPRVGEDAAVIDMGDRYLIAKTDPITFATDQIGWYAVNVNANDVACCGAKPSWFLATVMLPPATTESQVSTIFEQISEACAELDIILVGGHTEVTHDLTRPIVVGQMLGEVAPEALITTSGARAGDKLILTKGIALEGTAILAREQRSRLTRCLDASLVDCAAALLHTPGISVVRDCTAAIAAGGVTALHDPTEGGLAGALHELASAADVGLSIDESAIPILPESQAIATQLGLEPLGLIASGALLISAAPASTTAILSSLESSGIAAAVIGEVVTREQGCQLQRGDGKTELLPTFARDELARFFDQSR